MNFDKRKILIISIIFLPLLWVLSGQISVFSSIEVEAEDKGQNNFKQKFFRVEKSISYETYDNIVLYGSTYPNKELVIYSELDGKIAKKNIVDGDIVKQGDILIELEPRNVEAELKRSEAELNQKSINLNSTTELYKQKLSSESDLALANAEYLKAEAALEEALNNYKNISIKAPFSGLVEEVKVEEGEVISKYSTELLHLLDNKTLLIRAYIAENKIMQVRLGGQVKIHFATGEITVGNITHIANLADSDTRTFLVEVEIENVEGLFKAGMTAKLIIPTQLVKVHKLSPSVLSINDAGKVGIKYLDVDKIVRFSEVKIINEDQGKILISGPKDVIDIISLGHGFIDVGQKLEIE